LMLTEDSNNLARKQMLLTEWRRESVGERESSTNTQTDIAIAADDI